MPIDLTIVTPEHEAFRGRVRSVVLPGSEGDFGVLEGHERFLAPLRIGEVQILPEGGGNPHYAALSEGFAEVAGSRVVVMAEACELAEQIDVARAERAKSEAEKSLESLEAASEEEEHRFHLQQAALERALVRLQVASKRGR